MQYCQQLSTATSTTQNITLSRQIPGSVTRVPDLLSKSPTNICLLSNCVGINRITFVSTNEMDFSKPAIIFTTDRQWRYLSVRLQNLIQHWTLKMVTTTKKKIKEKDMFGFNVRCKWRQHECEGVVLEDIEGWCCWWWWNDQWWKEHFQWNARLESEWVVSVTWWLRISEVRWRWMYDVFFRIWSWGPWFFP